MDLYARDIDVAVYLYRCEADFLRSSYEIGLSMEIERVMESGLPVEVKVLNGAPLPFSFEAVRGEVIFCTDEEKLSDFMVSVARRYLDMAPLRRRYLLEAMG